MRIWAIRKFHWPILPALLALALVVALTAGLVEAQGAPSPPQPPGGSGPLGDPTGLTAEPGSYRGEVDLAWRPAANADIHWIWLVQTNGLGGRYVLAAGPSPGNLTVSELDAQHSYYFIVVAGQNQSDGPTQWSQWTNWSSAQPPAQPIRPTPDEPQPDLTVEKPTVNRSAIDTGESFSISLTVLNRGDADANSTRLVYYRSDNEVIDASNDTFESSAIVPALPPTVSSRHTQELTAPATPGTYYYGACVDVQRESDSSNNCSDGVRITVSAAPPDLTFDQPTVSNSAVNVGDSFSLTVTLRNNGSGNAAGTRLTYYLSNNPTIDAISDTRLSSVDVAGLAASESRAYPRELAAPGEAGAYYYGACVQPAAGERKLNNNCSAGVLVTVAVPQSDLVIEDFTVSNTEVSVQESFTLSATVRNRGAGPTGATQLVYYRSYNRGISNADSALHTANVSPLAGSGSEPHSREITAPTTPGEYYYGVCVKPVSGESNRNNNCSTPGTLVTVLRTDPDLAIADFAVSRNTVTVNSPTAILLSARVRNEGGVSSRATNLTYYRSRDSIISSNDVEVASDNIRILARSESQDYRIEAPAPPSPGRYYYGACAAPVSGEINTNNNCSSGVVVTAKSANAFCLRTLGNPLTGELSAAGEWTGDCSSENRPHAGTFARYYSFNLNRMANVIIELTSSSADTFLYLLRGKGISDSVLDQDDDSASGADARISIDLSPGAYTVEATTAFDTTIGDGFDLAINATSTLKAVQ